ncbi:MAG: carboxypeptidase regulatory-like domain-containing protein [Hyphomicrobiales bacterium]|nr:carboxypeptidase regulatory-like domain-containing protein [Hyphomicrobiales bacterium]
MSKRIHCNPSSRRGIFAAVLAGFALAMSAGPASAQAVAIDSDDIGGVVTGPSGPEAGVWVTAETSDLPTRYAKSVVTDDQGRYVIPDLPQANYKVWVRGYGLVDSPKLHGLPGLHLDHAAVPAPNEAAAAHYYPAIYWYSMLKIPAEDQFGGSSGIPEKMKQTDWLKQVKNIGCIGCHQLGQQSTRTFPAALGGFESSEEAWLRRIQSGQYGEGMVNQMGRWNNEPLEYYAEWTDRIAEGELPKTKPKRPEGLERNVVVTWWEWSEPDKYLHDLISSDRRNPTVNAYGPLFGSPEYSTDNLPILDPKTNTVSAYKAPVRDPDMPESLGAGHAASGALLEPSPYYGEEKLWDTRANNHNSMFDGEGRLWLAASVRGLDNPDFCKQGSDHPSAKLFSLDKSSRQLAMLDPKTMQYTFVDTCYGTHHLQFAYDDNDTLWVSGSGPVAGWLDTKTFLETGDAAKAQGWTAWVLDTNGNGRRDDYVEPDQPVDPAKDKRIVPGSGPYAVMPSPVDNSIWFTAGVFGGTPAVVRLDPGSNPPDTALAEIYNVPMPGFGIRGGDIDSKGVVWASLSSGHVASFDRGKCKQSLNGPKATGDHCPEGWAFYKFPGPGFEGIGDNSAESSYYTWVDQHNVLGLGNDVPISTGNLNDGLIALVDGKTIVLRVPYPMGHYSKGLDGRIDDPDAGWKGRGVWTASGDRTPWLKEGGKGTRPLALHFQVRPDPLAH